MLAYINEGIAKSFRKLKVVEYEQSFNTCGLNS